MEFELCKSILKRWELQQIAMIVLGFGTDSKLMCFKKMKFVTCKKYNFIK
ncbi:hypothetical protein LEP1GSC188_0235 [Leptospira weilii serovar Topaz str. LT2116]|uniref:Uncharacterized protein n=1 Tax=Leptospira weilii serovar Topaz str. LT2116 TaxID=1088540 RepID=M3G8X5_9LEPT|nr:hypothetical protein LEP1GSC188_0235 [Leptospira weilii serovar Topaz str. LT2116]